MYKAYDDQGIIKTGRARECFYSIVNWLESDEAENVYSEDDLVMMIDIFNSEININEAVNNGSFSFNGFTVEMIEE